jgi:hypothetical protein
MLGFEFLVLVYRGELIGMLEDVLVTEWVAFDMVVKRIDAYLQELSSVPP